MEGQERKAQKRNLLREGAKARRENSRREYSNVARSHGELTGERTGKRMNSIVSLGRKKEERRRRQKVETQKIRNLSLKQKGLTRRDLEQEDRARRLHRREFEVALDTFGRDHYVLFGILALVVVLVWLINNIVENLS